MLTYLGFVGAVACGISAAIAFEATNSASENATRFQRLQIVFFLTLFALSVGASLHLLVQAIKAV